MMSYDHADEEEAAELAELRELRRGADDVESLQGEPFV